SPWSRGGWVNSQLFDHTSTLQFLEHFVQNKYNKSTTEENISAWRRAISGNLTSTFRPHDGKEPKLAYLNRDKFVVSIQQARYKETPSNFRKLTPTQIAEVNNNLSQTEFASHQEKGIRPACALPYELYAEGGLSADGTKFALHMTAADAAHGKRSMGAPFNVYLHNTHADASAGKGMMVATYTVKAGDTLREELPLSLFADGRYAIDVHGPNGFFRSFTGDAQAPAVQVETAYAQKGSSLTGDVQLKLRNTGAKPVTVGVKDNSYKSGTVNETIAAGQMALVDLDLKKNHGWYDFTVRTEGSKAEARFAGRVETGRSSFSDPLMGSMV
ncbi:MAG: phospholipase domain-containing protein, partial [Granulicella sp.]